MPWMIPLLGAGLIWGLPRGRVALLTRRWLVMALLLGIWASLALWRSQDAKHSALRLDAPLAAGGASLNFVLTPLGVHAGLVLTVAFTLLQGRSLAVPLKRYEAVALLVALGAVLAGLAAANPLTLCLTWGLMDLGLISLAMRTMESQRRVMRFALGNLLSTLALIAAVLLATQQDVTGLVGLAWMGAALKWLLAAALLRFGVYPLPGGFGLSWEPLLISFCMGSYLWLQLGNMPQESGIALGGMSLLLGESLLLTAILDALSPVWVAARVYLLLHSATVSASATLVAGGTGQGVVLLNTLNLALGLALIPPCDAHNPTPSTGQALLSLIPLASLAGAPLTLGFACHWTFLKLCLLQGAGILAVMAMVSYVLLAVPLWGHASHLLRQRQDSDADSWPQWIAFLCGLLGMTGLIAMGLAPAWLARAWLAVPMGEILPPLKTLLFAGINAQGTMVLLLVTLGILWGSRLLMRVLTNLTPEDRRGLDLVGSLVELDWLYVLLERWTNGLQRLLGRTLAALEGPLCITWSLLWILSAVLLALES